MDVKNAFFNRKFDEILKDFAVRAIGNDELTKAVSELKKDIEKNKNNLEQFEDSKFKNLFKKGVETPTMSGMPDSNRIASDIIEQQDWRERISILDLIALYVDIRNLNKKLPEEKEKLTESFKEFYKQFKNKKVL